jgi:hypothetical protein
MLKNILKLEGAQKLTKKEKKSINGGVTGAALCPPNQPNGGRPCVDKDAD